MTNPHAEGCAAGRADNKAIELTARAKAFAGEGVKTHRFSVDAGEVRVWDEVAGHYTSCHSLSSAAQRRIRRLAEIES